MSRVEIERGQHLKTGDTEPDLRVQLYTDSHIPKDLSSMQQVSIQLAEPNSDTIVDDDTDGDVTIESEKDGRVLYAWDSTDTETAMTMIGEFVVTDSSGEQSTYPNDGYFHIYVEEGL